MRPSCSARSARVRFGGVFPPSLLDALEAKGTTLAGVKVAEAAIATFHTRALFEYRWSLDELAPPNRWAGSPRAVEFVQSLGFAPEWAGVRGVRRPPFVEVEGPFFLASIACVSAAHRRPCHRLARQWT